MSGDYSRHSFDPRRDFSNLFNQEGRVALDSDWNELASIVERRVRVAALDTMGRAVVPKETTDGFKITVSGSGTNKSLTIGRGRIYVDGLLAENHGASPFKLDMSLTKLDGQFVGVLAEEIGGAISYSAQPYLPPLPNNDGPHLVYLNVWQREVTYLEDPRLLEKALGGVDTTTRTQTFWQVKLLENIVAGANCATPDAQITGWSDMIQPSAGRLTAWATQVANPDDPCLIPPTAGYLGLENLLYRVEIHDGGGLGVATYKWSRDNGTVASNVLAISGNTLTVVRIGRDSMLSFKVGDWVEVTDDKCELLGLPGAMEKITVITEETRKITLANPLPAYLTPTAGDTFESRHTRIRRWDSPGAVKVPASGVAVALENGIEISFDFEPAGGKMRTGDYWNTAARNADASIEGLTKAPPRGIHHHYCRLAVVTFPNSATDCRVLWPPEFGGEHCGCSVCVTPESHNSGTLTIQQAVDKVKATGGTVCLTAGIYTLAQSVLIDRANSVRIVGQGWMTILYHVGKGPAVVISNSFGVTAESFTVLFLPRWDYTPSYGIGGGPGFMLSNAVGVTVQRCVVVQYAVEGRAGSAIALSGILLRTLIEQNVVFAPYGIADAAETGVTAPTLGLLTYDLVVRDNFLACRDSGVKLDTGSLHAGDTRLVANTTLMCGVTGITCLGTTLPGGRIQIAENVISAVGTGILIGTSATRLVANDISPMSTPGGGDGIALAIGLGRSGLRDCEIIGNCITGMAGAGIAVREPIRSAMIKQNIIRQTGAGIVMDGDSAAEMLSVENNQLSEIAMQPGATQPSPAAQPVVAAIRVVRVEQLQICGNSIRAVAMNNIRAPVRAAIDIYGCNSVGVRANDILDVGPPEAIGMTAAILVTPPFLSMQIDANVIRRSFNAGNLTSDWYALRIAPDSFTSSAAFKLRTPLFFTVGTRTIAVGSKSVQAVAPSAGDQLGIHGNHFFAWGSRVPIVSVNRSSGNCSFANNQCSVLFGGNVPNAIVELWVATAAVMGNIVRGQTPDGKKPPHTALNVRVNPFSSDRSCCTMLGNIASGTIQVQPAPPVTLQQNIFPV